jgi:phenylacetate-CoA ligase
MNYTPEIEKGSTAEAQTLQEKKLGSLLQYLNTNSPFYKNRFKQFRVDVNSISTIEDLLKIPPTTKDDLQNFNWDFLCVPKGKIVEYTATSGTLGKPVTIALTENDLQRLAYNESISFACATASDKDVFQLLLTLDRQFMAGIAYHEGIRKLGAGIIRTGPGLPGLQLDVIHHLKPTALVAVPSFLLKLIEHAEKSGVDLNKTSVQKIICIGENIRTMDLEFNTLGKKIKASWNVQLFSTYASTEMQTAFTECEFGNGGHHHPELLIVELLDEHNNPVPAHQPGEVTVTTLGVEGMPLLRYKTGDIAKAFYEPCSCGRTTMRLSPLLGRQQQMIKLRGTTLYPPAIFDILNQIEFVSDFAVEVFTNHLGTDDLKIHVTSANQGEVEISLKSVFQSRLRIIPEINFCSSEQLDALLASGKTRKLQRFIDRR